jgi:RNA polymerase sigma-70 factor (ECF subfamily)
MNTPVVPETRRAGPLPSGCAPAHAAPARRSVCGGTTTARVLDPLTLGDHFDRLFRAAWALCGSREDAEDLVQDTYARVLARPRVLRGGDDLGYLLRVLRNSFISGRRAAAIRPRAAGGEPEAPELPDPRAGAEPPAAAEAREVFAAIAALPPEFRDALVAIDVAGLSYREAGKALRVREGTVASRLSRARSQVAKSLSPSPSRASV